MAFWKKALGGLGIEQNEERLTKRLGSRLGEQSTKPMSPQESMEIAKFMNGNIVDAKLTAQYANRIIARKKLIVIEIDVAFNKLEKLFSSENFFPSPRQIAASLRDKKVEFREAHTAELIKLLTALVSNAREYTIIVDNFANIVMHELNSVRNELNASLARVSGWENETERFLFGELTKTVQEFETLRKTCHGYSSVLSASNISGGLASGFLNIKGMHKLAETYIQIAAVESKISEDMNKFIKGRGEFSLKKIKAECINMKAIRGNISLTNREFGAAKMLSWLTIGNTISTLALVGMFCGIPPLAAIFRGPILKVMQYGAKAFYGNIYTYFDTVSSMIKENITTERAVLFAKKTTGAMRA